MRNEITTDATGKLFLNGNYTKFSYKQCKAGTRVNGPVQLHLPKTRYSLASEIPSCGNGRSQFFADFERAFLAHSNRYKNLPALKDLNFLLRPAKR